MTRALYRYTFADRVPLEDVEAALVLALFSIESLHGLAQVQLDAAHWFDHERRTCLIEADTVVGCDFNRLFVSFLRREFAPEAFTIERCQEPALPLALVP